MSEALSESSRYLATLDRQHRRANGVVYTPDAIVELVLDQEFGIGGAPHGPVLDPSCGAGAFVTGIVMRIAAGLVADGTNIALGRGRQRFLSELERLVYANDIDSAAIDLTLRTVRQLVEDLAPGPLDTAFLASNIVVKDFLADASACPPDLRHIVGNPPYVPIDRIEGLARTDYRSRFVSAVGRIDLYYLFMERASDALDAGGSWTLITPDKYLSNRTASALRARLSADGSIRTLSRFSSHSVFRNAATVPCVTTWVKGEHVAATQRRVEVDRAGAPYVTNAASVPRLAFQNSGWTFHTDEAGSLLEAITGDHPRLADHTTRISAGPATGYNPAFIVNQQTAAKLDDELVHPTVRGRDIGRFAMASSDAMMLIPYTWSEDGKASLVDLDDYPRTRRWLTKHRHELTSRHAVRKWGKAWWDLHDPITVPLHQTAKVLVPDVAQRNRFAVDHGRYVPQHSAYFLLPRTMDPDVLAAILNSAPVELVMRSTAPLVKDGFSRYRRQYLLDLPIPAMTVDQATSIREAARGDTPEIAATLAGALFNVDAHEVRVALDNLPR